MAAAAAAANPRVWVVSLAVLCAFLLGALWLASARNIAGAVERYLAVEGSVWADDECFVYIRWPATLAICALVMMLALGPDKAVAGEEMVAALGLRAQCRYKGPPNAAAMHATIFGAIYCSCAMPIYVGKLAQHAGAWRQLRNLADDGAAHLLKMGPIYCSAGFLSFSVVNCCCIIPYVLLRLMRFLRWKCVG